MITESELIDRVMDARHYSALQPDDIHANFRDILKMIHPDKCRHPKAQEATHHLLAMHRHFISGTAGTDDSGTYLTNNHWVLYQGEGAMVTDARQRQQHIASKGTEHLRRYMPYVWEGANLLVLERRAVPLAGLTLPQEHVNWVVSRLLEFCMLLHGHTDHAHLGLTPAHVMLVPETHGIAVAGFYHATALGARASTISAAFRHWYPEQLMRDKHAAEYVDLEMVKRLGAYLLGDRSGLGTSLIRSHHPAFVDFLLSADTDSIACYEKYRTMLAQHFPSRFIHLNI